VERVKWTLVSAHDELDPDRYLGEFRELPVASGPGDWCRVVIHDELGDMRWTLVVIDAERTTSIFANRPPLGDVLGSASPQADMPSTSLSGGTDGSDSRSAGEEGGHDRLAATRSARPEGNLDDAPARRGAAFFPHLRGRTQVRDRRWPGTGRSWAAFS